VDREGPALPGRLQKLDGHKPRSTEQAARAIVRRSRKTAVRGHSVSTGERAARRRALHDSTMQQEAAKQLGFRRAHDARRSELYGSVELVSRGRSSHHLHAHRLRTRVGCRDQASARSYIHAQFDKRYLPDEPNVYKGGRARSADAAEAIRPTEVGLNRRPEAIPGTRTSLSSTSSFWRRFSRPK